MAVATHSVPDPALEGYESLAPFYDDFTAGYDYEAWLTALEDLARVHGLRGRRLLDVACGTGKSFLPMLERGYEVTACDLSPSMVEAARRKVEGRQARVVVADMRRLPARLGRFDLITCLDDSLNYLLEESCLEAALTGMRDRLAPGGLAAFDCNSAATYRTAFRTQFVRESHDAFFAWRGDGSVANGLASATIDVFARSNGRWRRTTSRHLQRHWSRAAIESALAAAGLEAVAVRGQSAGGVLNPEVDEERHTKLVFLARRCSERGWQRDHPSVAA